VIKRLGIALCFIGVVTPGLTAAEGPLQPISLPEYKQELERLHTVVEDCAQDLASKMARKTTPPKACDPALVGPDEMVSTASGKRTVGYAWLRDSLRQTGQSSKESKQLSDAGTRLEQMSQEVASPPASAYVPGDVANIRRQLDAILDNGDFPRAKPPSYLERLWNDFVRWLLRAIFRVLPSGSSSSSIYFLELAVIAIPCGLLIWWFVRKLQMQKLGLPRDSVPHASAPSAQPWDEWLEQGQKLGGEGRWREAIHHVYWAAISCLESRRLWPADRTRTPREYVGLLHGSPETRADLSSLTRSFEHTWYGETPAEEKDFDQACSVLKRIAAR
jgi:Domain of unknown function (DUF4129)